MFPIDVYAVHAENVNEGAGARDETFKTGLIGSDLIEDFVISCASDG